MPCVIRVASQHHLQESRLLRRCGQDAKELQAQRKKEQEEAGKQAAPKTLAAANGFEFTNPISSLSTDGGNEPAQDGESAKPLDRAISKHSG